MFGFGKPKDPDVKALRREGLNLVRENHRLRHQDENLQKEMNVMREELRRQELIIREYQ